MGLLSAIFGGFISAGEVEPGYVLSNQAGVADPTVTEVERRGGGVIIHMGNNRVDQKITRLYSGQVAVDYAPGKYDVEIGEAESKVGEYDIEVEEYGSECWD